MNDDYDYYATDDYMNEAYGAESKAISDTMDYEMKLAEENGWDYEG